MRHKVLVSAFAFGLVLIAPSLWAQQARTSSATARSDSHTVVIWELHREGFPTVRHAWIEGSKKFLRVLYKNETRWYGFRPIYVSPEGTQVAFEVMRRAEDRRGEVSWPVAVRVTVRRQKPALIQLAGDGQGVERPSFRIEILDVKHVTDEEIAASERAHFGLAEGEPLMPNCRGDSCCATCAGTRACDCSACIPQGPCSCCCKGCYCPPCP